MLKRTMLVAATAVAVLAATALPAGAQQYPPAPNFCTVSDTTPTAGQSVTLTCGTYLGGATVTFTFFSAPASLGSATADASGVVTADVTIPSDASLGAHTIEATGDSESGTLTNTVAITVVGAGAAGDGDDDGKAGAGAAGVGVGARGAGGLPTTGSDATMPLARAAALLLAVGGVLILATRRRRAEAETTGV